MSFFERFLTKVNFFLIDRANRTRFSETGSLSDQNCMLKNFLNPQGDRESRLLKIVGHSVTKTVSHNISQILTVT